MLFALIAHSTKEWRKRIRGKQSVDTLLEVEGVSLLGKLEKCVSGKRRNAAVLREERWRKDHERPSGESTGSTLDELSESAFQFPQHTIEFDGHSRRVVKL